MIARGEDPPAPLLGMVSAQLKVAAGHWERYADRDQTRREHQQELVKRLGLTLFTHEHARELVTRLVPMAMQTTQGIVLVRTLIDELRKRQLVVPPVPVLELIAAHAATHALRCA